MIRGHPVSRPPHRTGWRAKAEILPLEWRHADWEADRIYLEGRFSKNGEPRYFPFKDFPPLHDVIKGQKAEHDRLAAAGVLCPFIFHRNGARIRDYRKAWESASTAAGCPGRIVHDFRRTAARNFIRAGVSRPSR
jgi:integrase